MNIVERLRQRGKRETKFDALGMEAADTIEALVDALILAQASHGFMLMSEPPQDAWKARNVDAVIRAALRRVEEPGLGATIQAGDGCSL